MAVKMHCFVLLRVDVHMTILILAKIHIVG